MSISSRILTSGTSARSSTARRSRYGRIDYGLLDGRLQVWEINTNPGVMLPPDKYKREQLPNLEIFAEHIRQAFEAVDSTGSAQPMVPIDLTECARRIRLGTGD